MKVGQSGATPWKVLGLQTAIQGIIKNARYVLDRSPGYLMLDFVSLVTSFCARLYGKRRSKRNTEKLIKELKNDQVK